MVVKKNFQVHRLWHLLIDIYKKFYYWKVEILIEFELKSKFIEAGLFDVKDRLKQRASHISLRAAFGFPSFSYILIKKVQKKKKTIKS